MIARLLAVSVFVKIWLLAASPLSGSPIDLRARLAEVQLDPTGDIEEFLFDKDEVSVTPPSTATSDAAGRDEIAANNVEEQFSAWMKEGGFAFQGIDMLEMAQEGRGRGLVTTKAIPKGTPLFTIPLSLAMTRETAHNSRLKVFFDINPGLSDLATLGLHLLYEKSLGNESYWSAFINHLPSAEEMYPTALWSDGELLELKGTHLYSLTMARKEAMERMFAILEKPMTAYVEELGSSVFPPGTFTKNAFSWALSIVWAFSTNLSFADGTNELMLIPLLDSIWHRNGEPNGLTLDEKTRTVAFYAARDLQNPEALYINIGEMKGAIKLLRYGLPIEADDAELLTVVLELDQTPTLSQRLDTLKKHDITSLEFQLTMQHGTTAIPDQLFTAFRIKSLSDSEFLEQQDADFTSPLGFSQEVSMLRQFSKVLDTQLKTFDTTLEEDMEILRQGESLPYKKKQSLIYRSREKQIYRALKEKIEDLWRNLLYMDVSV